MSKVKQYILRVFGFIIMIAFSNTVLAASHSIYPDINVAPPPPLNPTNWWTMERVLLYVVLPLMIIAMVGGIMIFVKRKRK